MDQSTVIMPPRQGANPCCVSTNDLYWEGIIWKAKGQES